MVDRILGRGRDGHDGKDGKDDRDAAPARLAPADAKAAVWSRVQYSAALCLRVRPSANRSSSPWRASSSR